MRGRYGDPPRKGPSGAVGLGSPSRVAGTKGDLAGRCGVTDWGLGTRGGARRTGEGAGSSSAPAGPRVVATGGAARPRSGPTRNPWAGSGFPILFFLPILFFSPRRGEGGSSAPSIQATGLRSAATCRGGPVAYAPLPRVALRPPGGGPRSTRGTMPSPLRGLGRKEERAGVASRPPASRPGLQNTRPCGAEATPDTARRGPTEETAEATAPSLDGSQGLPLALARDRSLAAASLALPLFLPCRGIATCLGYWQGAAATPSWRPGPGGRGVGREGKPSMSPHFDVSRFANTCLCPELSHVQ